jgi:hypothetical protein
MLTVDSELSTKLMSNCAIYSDFQVNEPDDLYLMHSPLGVRVRVGAKIHIKK